MPFSVPSTAAPGHPGRFRGDPVAAGQGGLGGPVGGAFLPEVFGPAGRQVLRAAFGADLSADPGSWVWTDVTRPDVQWDPGINITIGATGTTAQRLVSAKLTAELRNDQDGGGDWTIGNALSRFGSDLRENTPVEALLDIGTGTFSRFRGYLTSLPQKRGPAGENFASLLANGVHRRVTKGKSHPFSAMRKSLDRAQPTAYWPLEKGTGGTVGASAVAGIPDMTVTAGTVAFGSADDSLPSSLPLAQFSRDGVAGQLTGVIPGTAGTGGNWSAEFVFKSPKLGVGGFIIAAYWAVTGTIASWDVVVTPIADGGLTLRYINSTGGVATYTSGIAVDDAEWHHARVDCQQTGGIAVQMILDGEQIISQTTTGTNGRVTSPILNWGSDADSTVPALGHFAVWNGDRPNDEDTFDAFTGHTGDTVAERMIRLGLEAGVTVDIVGVADDRCGPQRAGAFIDLLQDAIDVDAGGLLCDGIGWGYTYFTRQSAYSKGPGLVLDSADGDFPGPVDGQHSDESRINRYTARDPLTNADRTYEREDGPLGTDAVGEYDTGGDFRVNVPDQLTQVAAWVAGLGTVPGLRWPALAAEFAKTATAAKAGAWLGCRPLDRIDALGVTTGNLPDRRLLLLGWTERWNSKSWRVTFTLMPYDGYAVTVLAADTGDVGEFVGWWETDDDVRITMALPAGGTSVTVPTSVTGTVLTNPSVSTYADDLLGLYVNLDGLKVGVTAISSPSGGRQTLTLAGGDVLRDIPNGTPVLAWAPFTPGL